MSQRVVIVGGGFGGLWCARALAREDVQVTLIDRNNHHLFQPLLYQVAVAGLSPADIAQPIRALLRGQRNIEVLMAEVVGIDGEAVELADGTQVPFDKLVLATGAKHSYFGHAEWEPVAPGLKTLDDATRLRSRILTAFELAERTQDAEERRRRMTFVVVGGGPTGVEMAGSIAELARRTLVEDFDHIRPELAQILLIEAGDRVLSGFDERLSRRVMEDLARMGVQVRVKTRVTQIDERGVETSEGRTEAGTVIWAAGVLASPAAKWLGVESDPAGRVVVDEFLRVPGRENVYVIGDCARVAGPGGKPLPGVAQVAMQSGQYVARHLSGRVSESFRYVDKGNMATIGRRLAIAEIGRFRFAGTVAWMLWLGIHIVYLIGFRNKISVLLQWTWAYLFWSRGARLITGREPR